MKETNNTGVFVVDFDAYTDGDWGLDDSLIKNHKSRYFEQDYYEYSVPFNNTHTVKFRRVYKMNELRGAICFLLAVRDSVYGRDYEVATVKKYFDMVITALQNVISNRVDCNKAFRMCDGYIGNRAICRDTNLFCYDNMDNGTEMHFTGYFTDENPKKIKEVIYYEEL